jgi:hypothetical protein
MTTPTDATADVRVDELRAELRRVRADLDDLAASLTGEAPTVDQAEASGPIEPVYPALHDWVNDYYLRVFPRPTAGEQRWCAQWDDHPEAVTRLEALWRSWETLRLDPNLGIATWLTTYQDPIGRELTSRNGTFAGCAATRHSFPGDR